MYWDQFSRKHQVYVCLVAVFVCSLILANLIGSYLFEVQLPFSLPVIGNKAVLSSGIIPFPVTFLLTDLLNEYYGKKGARFVTFVGFGMSILVFLYLSVINLVHPASNTVISQAQYHAISDNYASMYIASLTAYLIGQMLDIQVFSMFKGITGGRFLWFRATGSTVVSQVFDSFIVTSLAFWDDMPFNKIAVIATSDYGWKFLIALSITPFLYAGHIVLKRLFQLSPEPASDSHTVLVDSGI